MKLYKIAACAQKQVDNAHAITRGQQTTPTIKNGVLHTPDKRFVIVKYTRNDNVVSLKTKFKRHILEEFHDY